MKKFKVLVTGGSGYFGETLVKDLINRGYLCSVLDVNDPSSEITDSIIFHKADIRDKSAVLKATKGIDLIFHNVAQVPLAKDNNLFDTVNRLGTQNIVEAGLYNKCKHLIYTSSSAIYGVPESNPVFEETKPIPQESYGRAKLDGENYCLKNRNKGMNISIIRPRTILGRGRLGIFQILFEWIYNGKNVPVFDGGDNLYQFIHIDDLSNACILAAEKDIDGTYNIGTNDFCSMKDTLEALITHSKSKSKVKSLSSTLVVPIMKAMSFFKLSPLGPYHALMYGKSMYFDTKKANEELKWIAKYSNKEMIIQSYEWYLRNREIILSDQAQKSPHKSAIKQGALSLVSRLL